MIKYFWLNIVVMLNIYKRLKTNFTQRINDDIETMQLLPINKRQSWLNIFCSITPRSPGLDFKFIAIYLRYTNNYHSNKNYYNYSYGHKDLDTCTIVGRYKCPHFDGWDCSMTGSTSTLRAQPFCYKIHNFNKI